MFNLGIVSLMTRLALGPRCVLAMLRGRSPDIVILDCTPMSADVSRSDHFEGPDLQGA